MILDDKTILITGGTGSFGRCFARHALTHYNPVSFNHLELPGNRVALASVW